VAILLKLRGIYVGVLALMLIAQIIGVVTLLSDHTFHLYENPGAVATAPIAVGSEGTRPGWSIYTMTNAAHCTLYRDLCQRRRRSRRTN